MVRQWNKGWKLICSHAFHGQSEEALFLIEGNQNLEHSPTTGCWGKLNENIKIAIVEILPNKGMKGYGTKVCSWTQNIDREFPN